METQAAELVLGFTGEQITALVSIGTLISGIVTITVSVVAKQIEAKTPKTMEQRADNIKRMRDLRDELTNFLSFLKRPDSTVLLEPNRSCEWLNDNELLHLCSEKILGNSEFFNDTTQNLARPGNLIGKEPKQEASIILHTAIDELSKSITKQNSKMDAHTK